MERYSKGREYPCIPSKLLMIYWSMLNQLQASMHVCSCVVTELTALNSRLGIQAVLINEMNLDTSPKESMQFIHKRTAAPVFNSPHIAKCYGLYMNPKASFNNGLTSWRYSIGAVLYYRVPKFGRSLNFFHFQLKIWYGSQRDPAIIILLIVTFA